MRGQAEVIAPGELPAWCDDGRLGARDGLAGLRAVACLARALRAARLTRAARERHAAEGYRRLVQAILAAEAVGRDNDEVRAPAGAGRGSGR
jgi:hypothetical protein